MIATVIDYCMYRVPWVIAEMSTWAAWLLCTLTEEYGQGFKVYSKQIMRTHSVWLSISARLNISRIIIPHDVAGGLGHLITHRHINSLKSLAVPTDV